MKYSDPSQTACDEPTDFDRVLDAAISRRAALQIGIGSLAVGFFGGQTAEAAVAEPFTFQGVAVSGDDVVHVPQGYAVQVLFRWGDPVCGARPAFRPDAANTAAEQADQAGMGHDGMYWFSHPEAPEQNGRGLLCLNHEYADQSLLFPAAAGWPQSITAEMILKSQAAHGISVIEVEYANGRWHVNPSQYNRRITANTPMRIAGPAAALLGENVNGTLNNCAAGKTPWGTYLTCEENFHSVFGTSDQSWRPSELQARYRFTNTGYFVTVDGEKLPTYAWWRADDRFDIAKANNDSERFGYVVEIDPRRPDSLPVKRTALGRIKHENAAVTIAPSGQVVVYMGDDERGEYIYKYVSRDKYNPQRPDAPEHASLLDEGTLYAARFDADFRGQWLELTPGGDLPTPGHVCAFTRKAADTVHATRMDRPEWVAVDEATKDVFVTLTNNDKRVPTGQGTPDKPEVDAANPRPNNVFGHIVRWREQDGNAASLSFEWDIFLLAGDPQTDPAGDPQGGPPSAEPQVPAVSIRGDSFGSPDGLWFDPSGILWIQTDVSTERLGKELYRYLGNNMMLAADPQRRVVRRFLTGPCGCEITGVAMSPDRKALFVNIQHPGESGSGLLSRPQEVSSWPDGPHGDRPRPATIVVTRLDGGDIGT